MTSPTPLTIEEAMAKMEEATSPHQERLLQIMEDKRPKEEWNEVMGDLYRAEINTLNSIITKIAQQEREAWIKWGHENSHWDDGMAIAAAYARAIKDAIAAIGKLPTTQANYSSEHEVIDTCKIYKALLSLLNDHDTK